MGGLFSSPKAPPPPAPTPPPPTPTDPTVTAAADALAREQAQANGARATMLTGGQGTSTPTTARKSLLGS
jgi:hypothetical protein